MDSGNSGSMSSSGDEEYDDSRSYMVPPFLNNNPHHHHPPPQFASFPFLPHHQTLHAPPMFEISPNNFLHSLSSQTHHHHLITNSNNNNNNPTPFLNLDTGVGADDSHHIQHPLSHPTCTTTSNAPNIISSSSSSSAKHHSSVLNNASPSTPPSVRNPKKRTRASRRAPTTVLTTDTSNFRAMVQEFTGIPSPPFSGTSYSRRLDLLTTSSSSLRSSSAATQQPPFYRPLRPLMLSSSASPSPSPSTLMLHNNHVVADDTGNNPSTSSLNYQNETTVAPYNTLTMQILPSQTEPTTFNNTNHSLHVGLFSGKSTDHPTNSSMPSSVEHHLGMAHNNSHLIVSCPPPPHVHHSLEVDHSDIGGNNANKDDDLRSFHHVAAPCKFNFSAGASSSAAATFNSDESLEINNNNSGVRGEGNNNIESWICSSD